MSVLAMRHVPALVLRTFVRSFVIVAVIVKIVFPVVVVKLNATQNNVHVIWPLENATRTYVKRVVLINFY
jgi:hypothetical protein